MAVRPTGLGVCRARHDDAPMRLAFLVLASCATPVTPPAAPTPPPRPLPPAPVEPIDLAIGAVANASPAGMASMDWPKEVAHKDSGALFRNVGVLQSMTGEHFMSVMHAMKPSLGVACAYCHDAKDYAADALAPKKRARQMLIMAAHIDERFFDRKDRVTCFTCHRGAAKPELPPAPTSEVAMPADLQLVGADADAPMRKRFKNVRVLAGPASRLVATMASFTRALGVDCAHCHVPGAWDRDDKPAKMRARQMLQLVAQSNAELFGTDGLVQCWTCHRGTLAPSRLATSP